MTVEIERGEAVVARLLIDKVFKGQVPRTLVVRAEYRKSICSPIEPPKNEPFYAFATFSSGNIQAPDAIAFVPYSALPANFEVKLGRARSPGDGAPLLERLAPSTVPRERIQREEGDVSKESWLIQFGESRWLWDGKPRFYLRYPRATFLIDQDYVLEKAKTWRSDALLKALRQSLPLTESTDLYKYHLNLRLDDYLIQAIDRLAVEATMDGRVQIMSHSQCCLRVVRIERTSLGTQGVYSYETELARSTWSTAEAEPH